MVLRQRRSVTLVSARERSLSSGHGSSGRQQALAGDLLIRKDLRPACRDSLPPALPGRSF